VATAQILRECESGDDDRGGAVGTQSSHGSQPVFEPAVVGLDPVVGVLLDVMPRRRHHLVEDPRVDR
jgi:hypothetical protein